MKDKRLIDILPSVFGVLAIIGAVTMTQPGANLWSETNLSQIMLYGGGVLALVLSLISVVVAVGSHKFRKLHALNVGWFLFIALYFILFARVAANGIY